MKTATPCRPSDDVWRCCSSTCLGRGPISALRDGSRLRCPASVEAERHQTALRGRARCPIREADCRCRPATPQKPLRADEPAKQNGELDPRRVTASGRRAPEESRPPCGRGDCRRAASAQLVVHSVVGPHRSGDGPRGRGVDDPVTGRGPIQTDGVGHVPQRDERGRASEVGRDDRGRRWCPSSACSSPDRAGGSRGRRSGRRSCLLLRGGLGFVRVTRALSLRRSGTAWRRTAPASSTGGRPSGRASPPAPPAPCACHASSPAAASTPWPWANSAASGTPPR